MMKFFYPVELFLKLVMVQPTKGMKPIEHLSSVTTIVYGAF